MTFQLTGRSNRERERGEGALILATGGPKMVGSRCTTYSFSVQQKPPFLRRRRPHTHVRSHINRDKKLSPLRVCVRRRSQGCFLPLPGAGLRPTGRWRRRCPVERLGLTFLEFGEEEEGFSRRSLEKGGDACVCSHHTHTVSAIRGVINTVHERPQGLEKRRGYFKTPLPL